MKAKQDTTDTGAISKDNTVLRCGDCMHYAGSPHPAIGQACSLRGVRVYATAPNCYTPNVHLFRKTSPQTFALLSSVVSSFSPAQARVMMGLLKQQAQLTRAHDIAFLEKVYFKIGEEYLSNYYAGFALGLGVQKEILIVGSQYFSDQKNAIVAQLDRRSVLRRAEFVKIRKNLELQGKLNPPRTPVRDRLPDSDYEPPTIETSVDLLEKRAQPKTKKKVSMLEIRDES